MKKILLGLLIVAALLACSKEKEVNTPINTSPPIENVDTPIDAIPPAYDPNTPANVEAQKDNDNAETPAKD